MSDELMFDFTDWEAVVKLSDDFNGADLRNVCTEAGELEAEAGRMSVVLELDSSPFRVVWRPSVAVGAA